MCSEIKGNTQTILPIGGIRKKFKTSNTIIKHTSINLFCNIRCRCNNVLTDKLSTLYSSPIVNKDVSILKGKIIVSPVKIPD